PSALQVRRRRGGLGRPPLPVRNPRLGDQVPAPLWPSPLLHRAGDRLPVPGQPGQGRVHLAVPQRPAPPEVRVIVPFQVIPVAWPPLEQAKQRQRNTHSWENTPRVFSQ